MTYAEYFENFKSKFMGTDVSNINEHLAYQFNIVDEDCGGIFYVEVKDGELHIEPYEYFDRDAIFISDAKTLMRIAEGKEDPVFSYTVQTLRVEGDLEKALKLKDIIELKKKEEKAAKKKAKTEAAAAKKTTAKAAPKKTAAKTSTKKTTAKAEK